jgi:hypothetical protein
MSEAFDRAGVSLGKNYGTIYQAPQGTDAGTTLVLSCLAAFKGASSAAGVSLELEITDAEGQTLAVPVQREFVGPGMTLELMPNRVVLLPGERLRGRAGQAGVVDVLVSTLAPEALGGSRGIPSLEVYARFLPPDTVGTDQNVVELPAPPIAVADFPPPAVITGFAVQVPALGAVASFPAPELEPVRAFLNVPSASLQLEAQVPFIGSSVPAIGLALFANAPSVATGTAVSVPAVGLALFANAPSVATGTAVSVPAIDTELEAQSPAVT